MKKYFFIIVSLLIFLGCNNSKTNHENQLTNLTKIGQDTINNGSKQIIKIKQDSIDRNSKQITKVEGTNFIKEFYNNCYQDDVLNSIEKFNKYVEDALIKKIANIDIDKMDYDPFINGQDFSASSIKKSLEIDSINTNTYDVSLKCFENDSLRHIILKLKRGIDHKIKISMIENNPILNP